MYRESVNRSTKLAFPSKTSQYDFFQKSTRSDENEPNVQGVNYSGSSLLFFLDTVEFFADFTNS